ncbi:hypothetical protein FGO68_gene12979 [Halteria grandinella]|uniref:Uncharacterized protein n=1 Tax=Halteria grandinella TaxID=5974 RepID=A0A8J8NGY6_HALGN|nr:hypothetical protein FGO68_gene12979 [Halteria grandinella]
MSACYLQENQKLEELIMMNGTTKNGWKATVEALKSLNYERSIKACKERYLNHSTKRNLTTFKFQDLIEHLKISGNKWVFIIQTLVRDSQKNEYVKSLSKELFLQPRQISFTQTNPIYILRLKWYNMCKI